MTNKWLINLLERKTVYVLQFLQRKLVRIKWKKKQSWLLTRSDKRQNPRSLEPVYGNIYHCISDTPWSIDTVKETRQCVWRHFPCPLLGPCHNCLCRHLYRWLFHSSCISVYHRRCLNCDWSLGEIWADDVGWPAEPPYGEHWQHWPWHWTAGVTWDFRK